MIIRGILDRSLSNQICIRGFARIKELARISKANREYQRELLVKQKDVVSNFLTEETYLFFPEVILSLKLRQDVTIKGAKTDATPIQLIEKGKDFSSNIDKLKVRSTLVEQKNFDINETNEITVVEVEFDDAELEQLIRDDKHPLHRIDGNHRLTAAEEIRSDRISKMNIPFCIVLFEETFEEKFNPATQQMEKVSDTEYKKFERVVFYNINSKSIPLTLEENLRSILGAEKYFDDQEIEKIFSNEANYVGLNARKLGLRINPDDFQTIKSHLSNHKWSIALNIYKLYNLFKKGKSFSNDVLIETVFESLQAVNATYRDDENLNKNKNTEILLAFLYYKSFSDKTTFTLFYHWIINNHLFEAKETTAESIIRIFNKIKEREIKVFVAMPYFSKPIVDSHNDIYKSVIDEIKTTYGINISLHPIMTYEGETVNIVNDIFEKIKNCNIFIANITDNNPNVTYEMGWARALKIPVIIAKEAKAEDPKSDYKLDFYFTYEKDAHITLKEEILKHIKAVLVDVYKFKIQG
ncbi:MAG TPA: hypothetical protein P5188_07510 [Flavobacterium sp.]|nr:hypothetical protein [Flavobacterium sp.]